MGIILDTNILIYLEQGTLTWEKLKFLEKYEEITISSISVSEFVAGIYLAKTPSEKIRRRQFLEDILEKISILDFDKNIAQIYGEIYAQQLKQTKRTNLKVHDLQIAATSLAFNFPILTANEADFKALGLEVIGIKVSEK